MPSGGPGSSFPRSWGEAGFPPGRHRGRIYRDGGSFGLPPNDDPQQGLHRGRVHVVGRCHFADGVSNDPIFRLIRSILAKSCGTAHPHIHNHRVTVSGDGTGERIRLGATQSVESFADASVCSLHVGTQSLRRDTLRVLVRLTLIVRPRDAGRERGDNAARNFHAPIGANEAQTTGEVSGFNVPRIGGRMIEEGSGGEEGTETVRNGGGGGGGAVHAYIVPCHAVHVNRWRRNIIIFIPSHNHTVLDNYQPALRGLADSSPYKQPSPERIGAGTNPLRFVRAPPRYFGSARLRITGVM